MTDIAQLQSIVESAFEARETVNAATGGEVRASVEAALDLLDSGTMRVAENRAGPPSPSCARSCATIRRGRRSS